MLKYSRVCFFVISLSKLIGPWEMNEILISSLIWGITCELAPRRESLDFTNDTSTLVYLNPPPPPPQHTHRGNKLLPLLPHSVTRTQLARLKILADSTCPRKTIPLSIINEMFLNAAIMPHTSVLSVYNQRWTHMTLTHWSQGGGGSNF